MSDTPRTDSEVTGNSDPQADEYEDLAIFTRSLELELTALRAEVEGLRKDAERLLSVVSKHAYFESQCVCCRTWHINTHTSDCELNNAWMALTAAIAGEKS